MNLGWKNDDVCELMKLTVDFSANYFLYFLFNTLFIQKFWYTADFGRNEFSSFYQSLVYKY